MMISVAVKHLIAAGVSGDALVQAIAEMEAVQPMRDKQAERRRAADRQRKAEARLRKSAESAESADSKEMVSHTLPKENNLTVINSPPIVPPQPKSDPEGFKDFWGVYPKRDGNADRKAAVKAFNAARKRADLETLIGGAKAYANDCAARQIAGTAFVRQARTWLNADGWTETYDATPLDAEARKREEARRFIEEHNARSAANGR